MKLPGFVFVVIFPCAGCLKGGLHYCGWAFSRYLPEGIVAVGHLRHASSFGCFSFVVGYTFSRSFSRKIAI